MLDGAKQSGSNLAQTALTELILTDPTTSTASLLPTAWSSSVIIVSLLPPFSIANGYVQIY